MLGTHEVFTLSLSLMLIILILLATRYIQKRYKILTVFQIASYFYGFIYAVIPIYYVFNTEKAPYGIPFAYSSDVQFLVVLMAILGYLVLFSSYVFGSKVKFKKKISSKKPFPIRKYEWWAYITFIFGMLGVIIEIQLQGGLVNSIRNIELIRDFGVESSVKDGRNNPLVFFRMFKPFMIVAFYLFYMLSRVKKQPRFIVMALITFVLTSYIIFINGGRVHIFIFLITILVGFLYSKRSLNRRKIQGQKYFTALIVLAIGAFSLVVLDPIFSYLTFGKPLDFSSNSTINSIMTQFAFPYSNTIFVTTNDFVYRFFQDYFIWILSLLPSFLTSRIGIPELTPLYEYSTLLQKSTMVGGGLPTDILTFGYYQLGITGIVLSLLIFGIVISRIDKLVFSLKEFPVLKPIVVRVVVYIAMIVMYADLEGTFRSRYDAILLLVFLYDCRKYSFSLSTIYDIEEESIKRKKKRFRRVRLFKKRVVW